GVEVGGEGQVFDGQGLHGGSPKVDIDSGFGGERCVALDRHTAGSVPAPANRPAGTRKSLNGKDKVLLLARAAC
ncbi:MAG TPA: hypothetical protein VF450_16935, partial [Noviherbaspirillum sp.]